MQTNNLLSREEVSINIVSLSHVILSQFFQETSVPCDWLGQFPGPYEAGQLPFAVHPNLHRACSAIVEPPRAGG